MASDTAAALGRPVAKEVSVSELFGGFLIVTEDTSGMTLDSVLCYKCNLCKKAYGRRQKLPPTEMATPVGLRPWPAWGFGRAGSSALRQYECR
jgi:hypothetical protein